VIEICFRGKGKRKKLCKRILESILNIATLRGFSQKIYFNTYFSKHRIEEHKSFSLIKKLLSYINADECAIFINHYKTIN
ncbi:MAG: hypothetical protein ACJA0H_000695, partial [Francisellaceae bacterium]